jgi:hypothetical protein
VAKSAKSSESYESTRAANGRFGKGNPGGPGAPMGGLVARLRTALLQAVSTEDIQAVGQTLVKQARDGDLNATKLLLAYTVGAPHQPIAADTTEADALEALNKLDTAQRVADIGRTYSRY